MTEKIRQRSAVFVSKEASGSIMMRASCCATSFYAARDTQFSSKRRREHSAPIVYQAVLPLSRTASSKWCEAHKMALASKTSCSVAEIHFRTLRGLQASKLLRRRNGRQNSTQVQSNLHHTSSADLAGSRTSESLHREQARLRMPLDTQLVVGVSSKARGREGCGKPSRGIEYW